MQPSNAGQSVEVTATGTANGTPDRVILNVRVEHTATTVRDALAAVGQSSAAVKKAAGLPAPSMATTGTGIHERSDNTGTPTGHYTAWHTLRLTIADVETFPALFDRLAAISGNDVKIDGVRYDIADQEPLLQEARTRAFENARRIAGQYADLADRALGAVEWLSEGTAGIAPGAQPRFAAAYAGSGDSFSPGEFSVSVSVNVRWAWSTAN